MQSNLSDLKARYFISAAWSDLGLPGAPAKICTSPFPAEHKNGDAHPSFSVFGESGGTRWKDHTTGAGGDVFDFVAKVRGLDIAEAIAWVRNRLGIANRADAASTSPWPELRPGTPSERARLAELRNISLAAVRLAAERGFLHFGKLWGHTFWAITDQRGKLVEFRRLDGAAWPAFGRLAERKSHCLGSGKNWPIGTLESRAYGIVALMEGAPDLMAFFHFALIEGKTESIAPAAMLGAANHRLAEEAVLSFHGKRVVLYPHVDPAGQTAAKAWARQLRGAGVTVTAFDLRGIEKHDHTQGKDLNDLCYISADCFHDADNYRFWEVLP